MIKDIQTASFFLKDGLNDNSSFRWCFCPGEEGFGDESFEDDTTGLADISPLTNEEIEAAAAAEAVAAAEEASKAQSAALSQAQRDAANQMALADPTLDVSFNLDPNIVDRESLNELQQNYFDMLDDVAAVDLGLAQDLLDARSINTARYGIYNPEAMNKLEKQGLDTFGLGYRGQFEARSPKGGLSRDDYDPNTLTGAGTDAASDNRALFASFARANRGLTTVEAMAQYNATSPQDQQVSISDVQNMGFELNAPVGPQADFREAEAQRGFAQGLGMIGRSLAFGPIGVMSDIALSGTGKGVLGHIGDMFEKASGYELPEVPDFGLPTIQGTVEDLVGPSKDTMVPGSFGIGIGPSRAQEIEEQAYAELSSPQMQSVMGPAAIEAAKRDVSSSAREQAETEQAVAMAEVLGRAGFNTVNDLSLDFDGSGQIAPPPVQRPVIKEKEEIIKTPAPRFPVRDTTPDSAIRTLAQIYKDDQGNPDEQRARELLGIGTA